MAIGDILAACAAHGGKLIEITGGEPLEQSASGDLAKALLAEGYTVLCETNGTQPLSLLPDGVIRIMDLKCPSSGMAERSDWGNIELLTPRDEVKFVLADRADYDWARDVVARYALQSRCGAILFSAVYGVLAPRTLAAWILADGLEVRFQLQLHKYVWPPDQRGV